MICPYSTDKYLQNPDRHNSLSGIFNGDDYAT